MGVGRIPDDLPHRRRFIAAASGPGCGVGAVRSVIVVVALEVAQYGCSVPSVDDQKTVEESRRMVPMKRSAIAFARGTRTGVLMIWMSMR